MQPAGAEQWRSTRAASAQRGTVQHRAGMPEHHASASTAYAKPRSQEPSARREARGHQRAPGEVGQGQFERVQYGGELPQYSASHGPLSRTFRAEDDHFDQPEEPQE